MKFRNYLLVFLASLLFLLVPANAVFAESFGQDPPEDPEEIIQVVLVLDVSDSMRHPILTDDLPQELLALSEQITSIENDPQLEEFNQAIADVLNTPELIAADEAFQSSRDALDTWFVENDFGDSLESIRVEIGRMLAGLGCDPNPQLTLNLAVSQTLDEYDHWINQSCGSVSIGFQDRQALRDLVPYLGNPEYIPLRADYEATNNALMGQLESLGYFDLRVQREQFYADAQYELMKENYNAIIEDQGIPRKIDLAKLAARTLLDLSRLDETAGRRVSMVALVIFSTQSAMIQELTSNLDAVEGKIIQLETQSQTNIFDALDDALEELNLHGDPANPMLVILLSDGHANVGPGPDQILADIPLRANEMDTTICTVGIGPTEAHVDWQLLRGLADETEGEYLFAKKGEELVNFFVACRQGIVGEVEQIAGYVSPDQPSQLDPVAVADNVCEISLALNYVAGNPQLEIVDPEGVTVIIGYPGYTVQLGENITLYTLLNPQEGEWGITMSSGEGAEEDIFYNIVITSNECQVEPTPDVTPTPDPTRTPIPEPGIVEQATPIIPLVALVVVVMGIFIVITLRRR